MATAAAEQSAQTARAFQFAVARTALLDALNRAATGLPRRGTMPILNCVMIRAGVAELTLTASDLDHVVETKISGVACSARGEVVLPAKRLIEIVAALPQAATINVAIDGNRAKLVAGRAKFDVLGMPTDEWPRVAVPSAEGTATVSGRAFVQLLGRVSTHVLQSESSGSMPAVAGVLLEIAPEGAYLVGTDRHRIVRLALQLTQGEQPLLGRFAIPKPTTSIIGKLFGDEETVTVDGTSQKLTFSGASSTLTHSLISERYPDYGHLLRFPPKAHAIVERADLAAAVKRVASASTEKRIALTFTTSELTLSAESPDAGRGEDVVSCAFTPHEEIPTPYTVEVNPQHIIDAIEATQGEQVRAGFSGGKYPIYVRDAKAGEDAPSLSVVLPLNPAAPKEEKASKAKASKGGK